MRKILQDDYHASRMVHVGRGPRRSYGFFNFIFDCILVMITGGFWLIWIFAREMRR